ncbi:MAG: hypothetical protein A2Y74_06580, partial [Actinobacteria bacterium RBG_13_63_9]
EWHHDADTGTLTVYSVASPAETVLVDQAPTAPAAGGLGEWSYAYNPPADSLRVITLNATRWNPAGQAFTIEGAQLLAHDPTATVKYLRRITDLTVFPAAFTQALAARLAADICVAVTGGGALLAGLEQLYRQRLAEAEGLDTIDQSPRAVRRESNWLAARRGGSIYPGGTPNAN